MLKKFTKFLFFILALLLLSFFSFANKGEDHNNNCVKLNTNIPGIGSEICIGDKTNNSQNNKKTVTAETAFPKLMGALTKIVVSLIIAVGFLLIVVGGVMITSSGADQSYYGKGKDLILKVVIGIVLLGLSGVILHMINPNFFK